MVAVRHIDPCSGKSGVERAVDPRCLSTVEASGAGTPPNKSCRIQDGCM